MNKKYDSRLPDIVVNSRSKNFATISLDILRDNKMTWRAKGLLAYLLSNKNGEWYSYKQTLVNFGADGPTSVDTGLKELEKLGYLIKIYYRDKKSRKIRGTIWICSDEPSPEQNWETVKNHLDKYDLEPVCSTTKKNKTSENLQSKNTTTDNSDDRQCCSSSNRRLTILDNNYINKDNYLNNESKDSFNAFSSEKAKTKRKRKRKKKTLESTPEQKIKYIENKSLIEYWNEQPNLRTHRIDLNNPSKTFLKSLELLNKMQKGKLFKRSQLHDDMLFNVPEDNYVKPYSPLNIRQAIKTLNDWYNPGNQPANKKCLQGLSLPDAIRNDRNGTSFLIQALYKGVQSVYDPLKGLSEEEQKAYKLMEKFFLKYKKMETLPNTLSKQILKWIKDSKKITNRPINAYTSMIVSALRKKRSENFNDYLFNELNLKLFTVMTTKALYPGANTFEKIKDAFKHTEGIDLLTESNQHKNKVSKSEQKWLNIVKEMYFREQHEKENNEEITHITNGNDEVIGWIVRGSNGTKDKIIEEIYKEGDVVRYYDGSSKRNKIKREIYLRDNN